MIEIINTYKKYINISLSIIFIYLQKFFNLFNLM